MADTLGADVKTFVDAVSLPETDYEVWLKAAFNAVEEWVGVQDSIAAVSSNTVLVVGSARTTKMTTGAGDKTVTLPAGSMVRDGQRFRVTKTDSGAGKCTLLANVGEADTIDGVVAATGIDIDSQYDYIEVEWMAGYWTIPPGGYKDHGSNANGVWNRYADGSQTCEHFTSHDHTTIRNQPIGTQGWSYYLDGLIWTYPVSFVAAPYCDCSIESAGVGSLNGSPTTTQMGYMAFNSGTGASRVHHLFAKGRWRT